MTTLSCERQSLALLATMTVFGASNAAFLASVWVMYGPNPVTLIGGLVMAFYSLTALRGTLEALSVYRYDESGVERRHPLRVTQMRWEEVRDFRIRRSTGDASVFLRNAGGRELRLDFQLLGERGSDLLRLMIRKLQPITDAKLEAMEREVRPFPRRHMAFIPLPGSVEAGAGVLRSASGGATSITLDRVREITVREVKQLVSTQDYVVKSEGVELRFRSFVDDSPLLLKYLRSKVAEDRWHVARSSGVFMAKLSALALVPVMAWCALLLLSQDAPRIAAHLALVARSEPAAATALDARPVAPGRFVLTYSFVVPEGQEFIGATLASGKAPAPGGRLAVRFEPERPYYNRPEDGQGFRILGPWTVLGPALVMLLLSLPYAAAVLVFKVRPDPFGEWVAE